MLEFMTWQELKDNNIVPDKYLQYLRKDCPICRHPLLYKYNLRIVKDSNSDCVHLIATKLSTMLKELYDIKGIGSKSLYPIVSRYKLSYHLDIFRVIEKLDNNSVIERNIKEAVQSKALIIEPMEFVRILYPEGVIEKLNSIFSQIYNMVAIYKWDTNNIYYPSIKLELSKAKDCIEDFSKYITVKSKRDDFTEDIIINMTGEPPTHLSKERYVEIANEVSLPDYYVRLKNHSASDVSYLIMQEDYARNLTGKYTYAVKNNIRILDHKEFMQLLIVAVDRKRKKRGEIE